MDKDLVARLLAEREKHRSNTKDGHAQAWGQRLWLSPLGRLLNDAAAELESLRAMRKRVEELADEYEKMGLNLRKVELRTALGDSHE